jgi:hypothetical protein
MGGRVVVVVDVVDIDVGVGSRSVAGVGLFLPARLALLDP